MNFLTRLTRSGRLSARFRAKQTLITHGVSQGSSDSHHDARSPGHVPGASSIVSSPMKKTFTIMYYLLSIAACAAASLAIGTLNGEHEI